MLETSPLAPLLTPQGWELLNSLPPYDPDAAPRLNEQLRRQGHPAELVAAALTQSRLRGAAEPKFGDFASRMLFTHEGLQQSTRLAVAANHARRFRDAGLTHVADLGCGLGGDSLALASLGLHVTAVDADEDTAAAATMNLTPFPEAKVRHSTAEDFVAELGLLPAGEAQLSEAEPSATPHSTTPSLPEGLGLWLDPGRRDVERGHSRHGGARRIWDPEAFSPPLSFVTEVAATGVPLGVKLGPGIPHDLIPADCEAEWVSLDGQVVEVALWFNALARPGIRRAATVMTTGATVEELTSRGDFETTAAPPTPAPAMPAPAGLEGLTGVLCEPDGAVIRAGLVADLAHRLGGRMLDEHIAYFTLPESSQAPRSAAVRSYRVLETFDFSVRRLRAWAKENGVTSVEIKKRGVDVIPETLRPQILPKKSAGARGPGRHRTLVVTRIGQDRVVAVVDPL